MKYGFIGLGSQGAPMAQRMIDAGLPVVLWARRPESLSPYENTSATFAESVTKLGEQVEHCGICVVDDDGVRQVCRELLPAMKPGGTVAIHATIHPQLCRELEQEASNRGLLLVDAPVSGGGGAAAEGALTVMVGGTAEAFQKMKPVLDTFSGHLIHLGPIGSGQMAKLVNNSLMAANLAMAYHAREAAKSLGIDPDAFVDLIKLSSGRSFAFDVCARWQQPTDFTHGAKMLNKDVRLLGEALGGHPAYEPIHDAAQPLLDLALQG
ncbi:NAD(P)-dependent oxidoreductase [Aestuariicella hydrocarbonica]|uniref:NAD(P)-dependent oxidoreductase n=1 Tax=Pseudomaricurvus hydrocarbonicus TaxID=1470433 RepID=A0A9E5JZQ6_9GAMM|nr:NAD(P)-dependent oxidoreductase [Aestuariicella hydrocarbonica]NHO65657.1 NAD(P)-dependent oxidoreductase [Aestuariicella hydrocarbonica]